MTMLRLPRLLATTATAVAVGTALSVAAPASAAEVGATTVFAPIESPGYPAQVYVRPDGRVYEGTYINPDAAGVPSKVLEFGPEGGAPTRRWTVPGQDLHADHGVQVATSDARGRLILLDRTPGRALRLDPETGRFTEYATFPDLPSCNRVPYHEDCEPGGRDETPMANYATWLPDGRLLVTDHHQDVIWQVPPGGGRATVWLGGDRFRSQELGLTGIVLAPERDAVYVTLASNLDSDEPDPASGKLFRIPLLPDLEPGTPRVLWTSGLMELPDGFAIGRSGTFYVALVGLSAQVARIGPDGREQGRFGLAVLGLNGGPAPFDSPSNARFHGTRILVANQSFLFGNAANQAILAVETGEEGVPEHIPAGAGDRPTAPPAPDDGAPTTPRLRLTVAPRRLTAGRRSAVRVRVTAPTGPGGARRSVRGATVRLAGRRARTDRRGRARLTVRAARPGTLRAIATRKGMRRTEVRVTVRRATRTG